MNENPRCASCEREITTPVVMAPVNDGDPEWHLCRHCYGNDFMKRTPAVDEKGQPKVDVSPAKKRATQREPESNH